ncbi:MAG: flagellar biosynthesis anti-sigma factor FlgM [Planctomycetales bacterium]|nr:flagellar biosynthesis anti-sigma factor FlgM [Planctomycetales bacterium]
MKINGPGHIDGAQPIRAPHRTQAADKTASLDSFYGADQVDISPEAQFVSQVHDMPEIRSERVADIRAQIEAGIYETDEKLDVAVGRLLDEIG